MKRIDLFPEDVGIESFEEKLTLTDKPVSIDSFEFVFDLLTGSIGEFLNFNENAKKLVNIVLENTKKHSDKRTLNFINNITSGFGGITQKIPELDFSEGAFGIVHVRVDLEE